MFRKLLQKLVDEYAGQKTYMDGDLEADLVGSVLGLSLLPDGAGVRSNRDMVAVLYDLGVLVALPAPADGEVKVDVQLAEKILRIVNGHRVGHFRACYACEKDVGPDAVKLVEPVWRTCAGGNPYRNVYAFCPDCAAAAEPEWRKG